MTSISQVRLDIRAVQVKLSAVLEVAADEAPKAKLEALLKKATDDGQSYLPIFLQSRIVDLFNGDLSDLQAKVKTKFEEYYGAKVLEAAPEAAAPAKEALTAKAGDQIEVVTSCNWREYRTLLLNAKKAGLNEKELSDLVPVIINGKRFILVGETHEEMRHTQLSATIFASMLQRDVVLIREGVARDPLHETHFRKCLDRGDLWLFGLEDPVTCCLAQLVKYTAESSEAGKISPSSSPFDSLASIFDLLATDPFFIRLWEEFGKEEGKSISSECPIYSKIDSIKNQLFLANVARQIALLEKFEGNHSHKEVTELLKKLTSFALDKYRQHFTRDEYWAMWGFLQCGVFTKTYHDYFEKFADLVARRKRDAHFAKVLCSSELPVPSDKVRVVTVGYDHVKGIINMIKGSSSAESKAASKTESKAESKGDGKA
ncbi:MAG: hypothetical protein HYX48_07385 [Chlamydiales bacterium]|nr:hypothetical protein [Chlamydiales bacterium]